MAKQKIDKILVSILQRRFKSIVARVFLLISVLVLMTGSGYCIKNHDFAFRRAPNLNSDAGALAKTIVTPHLDEIIDGKKNLLWCISFQLAWNEACVLLGEDIRLDGDPKMARILNKKESSKKDIDDDSFVAMAGFIRDGVLDKIKDALEDKFHGAVSPRLLGEPAKHGVVRPQDIVFYSYLFKNLEFPKQFENLGTNLVFDDTHVACFGKEFRKSADELAMQVGIIEYDNEDNFIIRIKTKSKEDDVFLAKVPPQITLGATISTVLAKVGSPNGGRQINHLDAFDVLMIPKFNFDIRKDYNELTDRKLITDNTNIAKDLMLLLARQDTRFLMDEKGVVLKSEAVGGFGCCAMPGVRYNLVFDKPFLVMLKKNNAENPYFALWVENNELLIRSE